MAAAEALALPEILEQILLAMDDTKTLLFAGRVNNHWRAVISDSVKLQEALFFRQSAPPTDGRFVERNPLLLEYGDEGCNLCDLAGERIEDVPHVSAQGKASSLHSDDDFCDQGGCITMSVNTDSTLSEIIKDTADKIAM
ncbi:hypothetical protein B0A48_16708 [Cryoendolithus antarcticus]|uniref:F-box domain-containing protein n=1 Tax=Cryoendolithus antarcticus TaxID=1507870 RepID=A0A1V8SEH7_9PEZI|nr:hypothetical protein B0A48_16708 [Cryoendolithus antarcticus]